MAKKYQPGEFLSQAFDPMKLLAYQQAQQRLDMTKEYLDMAKDRALEAAENKDITLRQNRFDDLQQNLGEMRVLSPSALFGFLDTDEGTAAFDEFPKLLAPYKTWHTKSKTNREAMQNKLTMIQTSPDGAAKKYEDVQKLYAQYPAVMADFPGLKSQVDMLGTQFEFSAAKQSAKKLLKDQWYPPKMVNRWLAQLEDDPVGTWKQINEFNESGYELDLLKEWNSTAVSLTAAKQMVEMRTAPQSYADNIQEVFDYQTKLLREAGIAEPAGDPDDNGNGDKPYKISDIVGKYADEALKELIKNDTEHKLFTTDKAGNTVIVEGQQEIVQTTIKSLVDKFKNAEAEAIAEEKRIQTEKGLQVEKAAEEKRILEEERAKGQYKFTGYNVVGTPKFASGLDKDGKTGIPAALSGAKTGSDKRRAFFLLEKKLNEDYKIYKQIKNYSSQISANKQSIAKIEKGFGIESGRYKKRVPTLTNQIEQLENQITGLKTKLQLPEYYDLAMKG